MKVKKFGWNHPEWTDDVSCTSCGSVLTINRCDLVQSDVHDIRGQRTEVRTRCCQCGNWITVSASVTGWGKLLTKNPRLADRDFPIKVIPPGREHFE